MIKNNFKKLIFTAFGFFVFTGGSVSAALLKDSSIIKKDAEALAASAGLNSSLTIGGIMGVIIQSFLGLLGIIFLVLVIYAGYNWMTARGEEEKVTKAKDTIMRAIIGLIIIIAAYGITYFVFNALPDGSEQTTNGSGPITSFP
jgi:cytochrome bd-type quinol oxidase subunit 2